MIFYLSRHGRIAVLLLAVVLAGGCSRGLKEGLYSLKGASGRTTLIQGTPGQLGLLAEQYGSCQVEPFVNDAGQSCPEEFLAELPGAIEKQLQYRSRSFTDRIKGKDKEEMGPFFTGPAEKILLFKGRVIQYDTGSLVDKAASPLDEAICRIKIIDAESGNQLAEINATGRVKSALRTGPAELAEGVAKAIKKALKPD